MAAEPLVDLDPIVLEVLWNRLISVCNEQAAALMRTSFTTIVRESEDLSAGVFDTRGNMIAQSVTGTPGHINPMATSMRHFLAAHPVESLAPGDVLITNDPWFTSGQLHDLTIMTPVFRGDRLVGFFGNTCHAADIGGRGLSADAREVHEEGLYIPILKMFDRGEPNRDLLELIRWNVRSPEMVLGDLHAQVACNDVGGARLLEFMEEFKFETIDPLADAIIDRSEQAMRAAIARLPDGTYRNESFSDGFADGDPIQLVCAITVAGDELTVDYAGSSEQRDLGVNVVLNYTKGYTTFGLKASISPEVPNNEGSFRPVTVTAPEGCILNARPPAAVAARHIVGHQLPNLLFGALVEVIPERVMAEGAASIWITQTRGHDLEGRPFTFFQPSAGGTGARPSKDGLDNTGFPSGVAGVQAEVIESLSPLLLRRREIRRDSGGPGKFRGGAGQRMRFSIRSERSWTLSSLFDRVRFGARGYQGGMDGARGEFLLSDGTRPDPKVQQTLAPDTEVIMDLPGGGGFFPPRERDPRAVLADLIEGKVSLEAAERDYGVVIRCRAGAGSSFVLPDDFTIDEGATARLRGGGGDGARGAPGRPAAAGPAVSSDVPGRQEAPATEGVPTAESDRDADADAG